jgi:hypothetical protein
LSRNQHHRVRDHFGYDIDTSIVTTSGVGAFPVDTPLHDVLQTVSIAGLSVIMDGLAVPVRTGNRGWVEVPFDGQITAVRMLADVLCNITVDIWKTTFAAYPPDSGDSICGSVKPSIASVNGLPKAEFGTISSPMTGWTTSLTAGDILWFHVDSNDLATMLTISLTIARA